MKQFKNRIFPAILTTALLTAALLPSSGVSAAQGAPSFGTVPMVETAPTIDGALDTAYDGALGLEISSPVERVSESASGTVKLVWDNTTNTIYSYWVVSDPEILPYADGTWAWENDGVEFNLDVLNDGANFTKIVTYDGDKFECYNNGGIIDTTAENAVYLGGNASYKATADGYILELAVTVPTAIKDIEAGDALGMMLVVNNYYTKENESIGRNIVRVATTNNCRENDVANFNTIVLGALNEGGGEGGFEPNVPQRAPGKVVGSIPTFDCEAPTIDGEIDAVYRGGLKLSVREQKNANQGDARADVYMLWQGNKLYTLFDVIDADYNEYNSNNASYDNEGVELSLDLKNDLATLYKVIGYNGGALQNDFAATRAMYTGAFKKTSYGYSYEIVTDVSEITSLEAGMEIGFNLIVNDVVTQWNGNKNRQVVRYDAKADCAENEIAKFDGLTLSAELARLDVTPEDKSGDLGNIHWVYNAADRELKLSGEGLMDNLGNGNYPWNDFKDEIASLVVKEGITGISPWSFAECVNLAKVTLPESLERIGTHAFYKTWLSSIDIPANVCEMYGSTFSECLNLSSVTIHSDNREFVKGEDGVIYGRNSDGVNNRVVFAEQGVTNVVLYEEVYEIDSNAFDGHYRLQSVVMSDSNIRTLPGSVFGGCAQLTDVKLPGWLEIIDHSAFGGCISLKSIVIPPNVTEIAPAAFESSAGIEVYFSGNAPTVGNNCFLADAQLYYVAKRDGWNVESGLWNGYNTAVAPDDFEVATGFCGDGTNYWLMSDGELTINGTGPIWDNDVHPWDAYGCIVEVVSANEGVTNLGYCLFYNLDNVRMINLPTTFRNIGWWYIPNSLESINIANGHEIFSSQDGILLNPTGDTLYLWPPARTDVQIPANVTTLNSGCFVGTVIKTIHIPSTVTTLDGTPFNDCYSLESVTVDQNNEYISVVDGMVLSEKGSNLVWVPRSSTEITVPDGVETLSMMAFANCEQLVSVKNLPEGLTEIPFVCFGNCQSLSGIELPSTVESIGLRAFNDNFALTEITIPASVKSIDNNAFNYSDIEIENGKAAKKTITFLGDAPELLNLGENGESNHFYVDTTIRYKEGTQGWDAAVWKQYELVSYVGEESPEVTVVASGTFAENADATWSFLSDGTLAISGEGAVGGWTMGGQAPYSEYCDQILEVDIGNGITALSDNVALDFSALERITIPASVETISTSAILNAPALETIVVIDGNQNYCVVDGVLYSSAEDALIKCTAAKTEVTILDTVKVIETNSFDSCTLLTEVTIPASVESIGGNAFNNCTNLTSVYFEGNAPEVYALNSDAPSFPETVCLYFNPDTEGWMDKYDEATDTWNGYMIDPYTVEAPDFTWTLENGTLTISGTGAVGGWEFEKDPWYSSREDIVKVVVETGITELDSFAIAGLPNLSQITLPEGLISINSNAIAENPSIEAIHIPASVEFIAGDGIAYCENLVSISVESTNVNYCALEGNLYNKGVDKLIKAPDGLTSIVVRDGVTTIGANAFGSCQKVTSITLPDSLTTIEDDAFFNCYALTEITIPASVTSIGHNAFVACVQLESVYFEGNAPEVPAYVGDWDFVFRDITTLYYKPETTGWNGIVDGKWNGYSIKAIGDANGDGVVTSVDLLRLYLAIAGKLETPLSAAEIAAVDSNNNGIVDVDDYKAMLDALKGGGC